MAENADRMVGSQVASQGLWLPGGAPNGAGFSVFLSRPVPFLSSACLAYLPSHSPNPLSLSPEAWVLPHQKLPES